MSERLREHKATALILRRSDVFDADRSYLLFTREFGVARARARGVRKPGSRLGGHLQLYTLVRLELVETGDWYLITQVQSIELVPEGDALRFLTLGSLVAETLAHLLQDKEVHVDLFDGVAYSMSRMAELCALQPPPEAWRLKIVMAELLLKALIVLGYRPVLDVCVVTESPLTPDRVGWSSELGGVVSAAGLVLESGRSFVLRDVRTVVVLRQFAEPQFVAERLQLPQEVGEEVIQVILHYVQTVTGRPLRSIVL
jgi:DNA repair protein RecO (recombination protein O)